MNPILRKVSILAIASVVLCVLVISGLALWIRSTSGTAFVLQKAKSILAEQAGISVEYSEISFDTLSHISLKNLHLKTFGAGDKPFGIEQMDLTIPELDADYAISIWTRKFAPRLEITHFIMSRAQMEFRGHALPLKPGAKTGLELTQEFIQSPPVDVSISNASIEKFVGHIDYKMGNQEFDVQLNDANSHFGLKVQKGSLSTDGDLEVPESSLSFGQKTENQKRALKTSFLAKTNWDLRVARENLGWTYKVGPSRFQGDLHQLGFEQLVGVHKMDVAIPAIHLTGDAELLEKTQAHGEIETSAVRFIQDGKTLQIGSQKMTLVVALGAESTSKLKLDAHYSAGLSSPDYLFKPSQLHWDTHAEIARDLKSIESESRAELSDAELFKLVFNVNENEDTQGAGPKTVGFHLHSLIHVLSDSRLSKVVKMASFLEKNGPIQTELAFDGHAKGKDLSAIDQLEGVLDASVNDASGKFGKWVTQTKIEATRTPKGSGEGSGQTFDERGSTEIREVLKPTISASAPFFDQPFRINHQIEGSEDLITAKAELDIPSISTGINGAGKNGKILDSRLSVKGHLQHGNILVLEDVSGEINRAMLKLVADGSGKLKEKEFESHGSVVLQMQDGFPKIPGQTVSGRIEFPWTLSIIHGRDIDFDGAVHLVDLAWSKDAYRVKGISGQVPISERLAWDGKKIQFSHLVHRNPFERVDFERIRPLIQSTDEVRIEQMGWEEKNYGPFMGFFAVDQNMLLSHQFDMNLGAGRVYGEMYFDAFPATLEFGILSRLTGINLSEVVPHRFLAKVPEGDDTISGRSGLIVKLTNGSIDGRVDITEIGSSQLVTFINILDPKFENEKMNRARSALGYGYPTLVGLSFDEGYMDMDLELSLLGISKSENIRGIAISPWISSATADVVSDLNSSDLNSDPESKNKADQESVQ